MSREAMQMALEALELYQSKSSVQMFDDAVRALRKALETEQEPVAEIQAEDMGKPFNAIRVTVHFYAEVPAVGTKLYKAPPKKEWVGLTADEIWKCNKASGSAVEFHICYAHQNVLDFAESIEAKLKEKNA